jgi:hypothetical protein
LAVGVLLCYSESEEIGDQGGTRMRRMPLSAETAVKLAEYMKVPLEHLMHMPQHILLQKLAEMAKAVPKSDEEKGGESS